MSIFGSTDVRTAGVSFLADTGSIVLDQHVYNHLVNSGKQWPQGLGGLKTEGSAKEA